MKKLIRENVFETNSSSCHSISLGKDTGKQFLLDTLYPDQHGVINLSGGEFGWEWAKYNDVQTKASYAATATLYGLDPDLLVDVIKEHTGADAVFIRVSDEYETDGYGYIDHESVGNCPRDKEGLKDFLFNKNSWLFTGNDNSSPDPTFYHVPEYKDGKVIIPQYKYELSVEGYAKRTKFLDRPTEDELTDAFDSLVGDVKLTESGHFDDDNSIWAQIGRDRTQCYEFSSWKKGIDYENQLIYFFEKPSLMLVKFGKSNLVRVRIGQDPMVMQHVLKLKMN